MMIGIIICFPILIMLAGYGRLFIVDSIKYDIYTGCPKDMSLCAKEEKLRFYIRDMSFCIDTAKVVALFCIIMMSPLLFFGIYDDDLYVKRLDKFDK